MTKLNYSQLCDINFIKAIQNFDTAQEVNVYIPIINRLFKQINTNICVTIDKYYLYATCMEKDIRIYIELPDMNYKNIIYKTMVFMEDNVSKLWKIFLRNENKINISNITIYFMISKSNPGYGKYVDVTEQPEYIPAYSTFSHWNDDPDDVHIGYWTKVDLYIESKYQNENFDYYFEF